jgi:hypothetical protein
MVYGLWFMVYGLWFRVRGLEVRIRHIGFINNSDVGFTSTHIRSLVSRLGACPRWAGHV